MESSERVADVRGRKQKRVLYYGDRKSDKLIRCYQKKRLGVFRVELELHSKLLREHGIATLDDLIYLPEIVCPKHLQFVKLDWQQLEKHLTDKFGAAGLRVFSGAQKRAASLQRARRYLSKRGVANVHRFVVPLRVNKEVQRALEKWRRKFSSEES